MKKEKDLEIELAKQYKNSFESILNSFKDLNPDKEEVFKLFVFSVLAEIQCQVWGEEVTKIIMNDHELPF